MGKKVPKILWIAVAAGALAAFVVSSVDLARYGDKVSLMRARLEALTSKAKEGANTAQLAEEIVSQYKSLGSGYKIITNINGVLLLISLGGLFLQTTQSKREFLESRSKADISESKRNVDRYERL